MAMGKPDLIARNRALKLSFLPVFGMHELRMLVKDFDPNGAVEQF